MDYEALLGHILDVGTEMIRCGGETHRVEDTLYRLADSFGFRDCNFWVVPSNIQATLTDPEGHTRTQVRHVRGLSINFESLDRLNALSRWACAEHPEQSVFAARVEELRSVPPQKPWLSYAACLLGGWGFALFFGCDLLDSLTALATSVLISFLVRRLSPREGNPLILNFFISFLAELLILASARLGLCSRSNAVTVGVVMLLISGLGATNGLRDLVHLDTLSGIMNITASFTGAIGIALGIALPLVILPAWTGDSVVSGLHASRLVQILSAIAACLGFGIWFRVRGRRLLLCALGAGLTWWIYLLSYDAYPTVFGATLAAAVFCGLYGQIMARLNKNPATIFTTICIFPLIPGSSLYYAMYGLVTQNTDLAYSKGIELGLTCFGIVLGFMIVEVVNRLFRRNRP